MADGFDPYHKWLAIPPEEQPPDLYRLLGVKPLESDPDVIEAAADRQMAHLRTYQAGQHGPLSQQLLNEVSAARITLLNAQKKATYDARLREELEAENESLPVAEPLSAVEEPIPDILTETAPAVSTVRPAARPAKKSLGVQTIVWAAAGGVLALGLLVLIISSGGEQSPVPKRARSKSPDRAYPARQIPQSKPPQPPPPVVPVQPPVTSTTPEPVATPDQSKPPVEPMPEKPKPVEPVTPPESKPPVTPKPEPKPAGKPAVPSTEAQKAVTGQLEEVYEISKLKKPSEKVELAKKLIELGQKSNDPTEQFVLLRTAMELAGDGGDAKLMLEAVDQIGERFEVEPLSVKKKVLAGFAAESTNSARIGSFIESADTVIDQAMADGQFDIASDLADRAYRLGQRSSGRKWRKQTHTRRVQVRKLQQSWQKNQAMLAKLKDQPDDSEANLAVGRWYCFERGDWQQGLPHLAKSSDAELKALAKQELESPPADSAAQLKLADGWWKLSESHKGDQRAALMLRAGTWYTESLPGVTSTLMRTKVERRMAEIGKLGKEVQDLSAQATDAAQGFKPGRWVDLLGSLDVAAGVVAGEWKMIRQGLATGSSRASRISLPVAIKGDYDLKVDLTRVGGGYSAITFPVGSNAATFFLGIESPPKAGLYNADGLTFPNNSTTVQTGPMISGRPYSVGISVRTEGENAQIGATLNNRPLLRWSGKTSSLGGWGMPTKNQPGLGAMNSTVVFHAARLRLVSGEAKLVKSFPQFRIQKEIKQPDVVNRITVSPDGSTVAVAARKAGFTVCDLSSGQLLHKLGGGEYCTTIAFHPKGSILASGSSDQAVKLWDPATGKLLRTLIEGYNACINSLSFNRDGSLLAIASGHSRVDVIDSATGEIRHSLEGHSTSLPSVAFNATGTLLASGDAGGAVKIWDLATDKLRYSLDGHTAQVRSLAFSPDGATLASGSEDASVKLWDLATGKLKRTFDTEGDQALAVSFSPDGSLLAVVGGGDNNKMYIWETATYELQQSTRVTVLGRWPRSLAFTPDGNTIITGGHDKLLKVWTRTPKPR